MRVLLTRAVEDSARTRSKLEAAGHKVLVSPVIEIVATGAAWPNGVVDAVLATSGQAFAAMGTWTDPSPEARRLMRLFLVGERTAEVARLQGFMGGAVVAANATMLALAVAEGAETRPRMLYLAGRDRKPDLETALDAIGHRPDVLEIYEAREADRLTSEAIEALWTGTFGTVLHFSRRSAGLFAKLATEAGLDLRPLTHLCLSDDVAAPLVEAGCGNVKTADAPNEASLLALVERR